MGARFPHSQSGALTRSLQAPRSTRFPAVFLDRLMHFKAFLLTVASLLRGLRLAGQSLARVDQLTEEGPDEMPLTGLRRRGVRRLRGCAEGVVRFHGGLPLLAMTTYRKWAPSNRELAHSPFRLR
jgi:hypothetical protein